ncbi:MAG TPA: lactate utilization protein C [Burkholderiales bacterium]|jgi:L-lactate dehydrogenase complex protein LldG|nr:lactate utilization protein C [Burkholderiales bacterium]
MSARENILQRVRAANGQTGALTAAEQEAALARLRAHPRGPLPDMSWELLPRFKERCIAMMSSVAEVKSLADVPRAVGAYLMENKLPLSGACWPEFANLDWVGAGLQIAARPANGDDKVGITGTYCALAENGTLMLLSGQDTHATTSLLPDNHIAVVAASRIVRAMEDGWDLLRREHGSLPRQVNFVSGPSRTADIEMTLVMGAHGPFRVHVIIVP